ncbi:DMT family transporter [Tabrizicola sp. BL-A-41-H6]|uniref:DMT family transporter n=1 Tax=Tabrizicola sp. BL-A-41-H6 TaxID=3421107 RepID=UPI003D67021C
MTSPSISPSPRSEGALKGVALVVAATFLFGLSDTVSKHLAMLYAVPLLLAVRYSVNLVLLMGVMMPRHGTGLWRTNRLGLVVLRGACLAAASISMVFALRVMPVGETVAIIYIAPFLVMLAAGPILGEKVSLIGWLAATCSFLGVLIIARPSSGLDPIGVALCLVNAGCATVYHLLTRMLTRTETTMAMLFHTALVGTVVFAAFLPWSLGGAMPSPFDAGLMVVLGVLGTVGHLMFTAAYREAPASLLAPVNYLHIVWAAILGWLVFSHMPDGLALIGMAMIMASGVAVAVLAGR